MNQEDASDIFVCHASEDKNIVRPLVEALLAKGLRVWYDDFELRVGSKFVRSIDRAISQCKFGLVVISPSFLSKEWPKRELDGLFAREAKGEVVILPVWHQTSEEDVRRLSPILASRTSARSSEGIDVIADKLFESIMKETGPPIGPGLSSKAQVLRGHIKYIQTSLQVPALTETIITVRSGGIERRRSGGLVMKLQVQSPFGRIQGMIERLKLDGLTLESKDTVLSGDPERPTVFYGKQRFVLPKGEETLDPINWLPTDFEEDIEVVANEELTGFVSAGTFRGRSRVLHQIGSIEVISDAEVELSFS